MLKRFLRLFPLVAICLFASNVTSFAQVNHLVISQVYGGGGNTGAQYTNDFIEIFNPTASAIDLSTYKIGYAASSGNFGGNLTLSGTLQPGHYYLIQGAAGANTATALPTPDATSTISLSGTSGIVVLAPTTTTFTNGTCPAIRTDLVNYGTGTYVCREGSANAPVLTNMTAALRAANGCTDTDSNSADFTAVAPAPRNSATTAQSCSTSSVTNPSGTGTATPNSVVTNTTSVLLSFVVTPGTNPTSTGITVSADLSSIGGSATQAFSTSDGTTFTYTITPVASTNGALSLPVSIADSETRTGSGTVAITVTQPVAFHAIHEIQGSKPNSGLTGSEPPSPYVGQIVKTTGVVTGITTNGFFIQAQDTDADADVSTPEGIFIFTSSAPTVAIGNLVDVQGKVTTFVSGSGNTSHTPSTELTQPAITVTTPSVPLPTSFTLTNTILSPSGGIYQMARYEGMRVAIPSITAVSGTDGNLSSEANAVPASNGQFYAVITGTPRPAREPGIDIRDAATPGAPANIAQFDDNPERLLIDTKYLGATAMEVNSNSIITSLTGIVDMSYSADQFSDPARIVVDQTYVPAVVAGVIPTTVAVGGGSDKFSIAAYNIERMFDTDSSNNKYFDPTASPAVVKTSSAVNLSATAFDNRITKVALGILQNLESPDIVGLEEIENVGVANAIAAKISSLASTLTLPDPGYVGYGVDSTSTFTNDIGGISTGFLVKASTVTVNSFTQAGQNEVMNNPTTNAPLTVNDRPAWILKAGIKRSGAKDFPVTVILNHLRSLSGLTDTPNYVRLKKETQAESLAHLIQDAQTNGEKVVSIGDYNAYEFSDGYTDTLGTVTGRILPSDQVVQPGVLITNPAATDLVTTSFGTGTYSYSFDGNTQSLDHIVVTSNLLPSVSSFMAVNINADSPFSLYGNPANANRASDHDPIIAYFTTPAPTLSASVAPTTLTFPATALNVSSNGMVTTVTNTGEAPVAITGSSITGDFTLTSACGTTPIAIGGTCAINVVFKPTVNGSRTGTLTLTTGNRQTLTVALTGTGGAPDFSFGGATGSTVSLTVTAGSPATLPLTFTSMNGFAGTVTVACGYTLPAPGVVCTAPAPFTLTGTSTQNVTFTTTARNVSSGFALNSNSSLLIVGLGALLMLVAGRTRRLARHAGLVIVLLGVCFAATGCGNNSPTTNPNGTPSGAYTYTITSTSGTLSRSVVVTLNVQ